MGWTIPSTTPKLKDLIADRVRTRGWQHDGGSFKDEALKHCYRGGRFSGVLWIVHERTKIGTDGKTETERWIECDLVRYYSEGRGIGNWGFKDMDVCMGPFEVSCPPSYLEMVPEHQDAPTCYCHSWRKRVIEHLAKQKADRAKLRDLHVNSVVDLKEGCHPRQLVIVSLRPLVGECGGRRYKIKMAHLA